MSKAMKRTIIIKEKEISFILVDGVEYFNLTEIGSLDEESRDDLIRSWMRNRLTLESRIVWNRCLTRILKVTVSAPLELKQV